MRGFVKHFKIDFRTAILGFININKNTRANNSVSIEKFEVFEPGWMVKQLFGILGIINYL